MAMPLKKASVCFTIRFYLPNGEQTVQLCDGQTTIAGMKQLVLKKKPHCFPDDCSESDLIVQFAMVKMVKLNDQDTIMSAFEHWPLFRESNDPNLIPELVILSKADSKDQRKLSELKPSQGEPIVLMGQLWRKRKHSVKFKKQFCLIQSMILFSYGSETDYKKDRPAKNVYPLGPCQYMVSNITPHCFQIAVENSCPGRTLVLKANNASDFRLWTKTLESMGFRYAKAQLKHLVEKLEQDFGLDSEGLFRISGSLPCMQALKRTFEKGVPCLEIPVEEHSICNMIKTIVRQLNPPLLTFQYFDEFMRLSTTERSITEQQKCERLRDIFGVLPATHLALSEYLFAFLNRVSLNCAKNKMNNYNLGVVFGPNVLRKADLPGDERCNYSGTQQQDLVAFIIQNYDKIFQKYNCLDFLHHKEPDNNRDTAARIEDVVAEGIQKHRPWSYTNGLISTCSTVGNMPQTDHPMKQKQQDIRDRDEGSISSFKLSKSDSEEEDFLRTNFHDHISAIQSEWDEHLNHLSQLVLEGTFKIQDRVNSSVSPILLANLSRCIEVEREWRQKAERNATLMINLLSRIEKQLNSK